jgi:hypothetical protein
MERSGEWGMLHLAAEHEISIVLLDSGLDNIEKAILGRPMQRRTVENVLKFLGGASFKGKFHSCRSFWGVP